MTIHYLTTAALAANLGMSKAALEKALSRDNDPPAPAAVIGDVRGWTLEQAKNEILPWLADRPGRGSGAGRPRIPTDAEVDRAAEPLWAWIASVDSPEGRARRLARLLDPTTEQAAETYVAAKVDKLPAARIAAGKGKVAATARGLIFNAVLGLVHRDHHIPLAAEGAARAMKRLSRAMTADRTEDRKWVAGNRDRCRLCDESIVLVEDAETGRAWVGDTSGSEDCSEADDGFHQPRPHL